jgi:RNA polymerase sigma-70 factor, ECF subfamily
VFVLRAVFDFDYSEIAPIVEKSEANCRQMFHRARQRMDEDGVRFEAHDEEVRALAQQFMQAASSGDLDGIIRLLAEDVTHTPDGGGKAAVGRLTSQLRAHRVRSAGQSPHNSRLASRAPSPPANSSCKSFGLGSVPACDTRMRLVLRRMQVC